MKEIKQYLHLYLGCECSYQDKIGILYEVNTHGCRLQGVFGGGHIGFGLCSPILRPLSDMTEEEAIELAALSEWNQHFRDVKTERNAFDDIIVTWDGMNESREVFNATGELFYCPEQFQWLLQKNFDLFQLIESGFAIDKTTLKTSTMKEDKPQASTPKK